ncbi:MAG: small subunit ribosomal protein S1 [Bacillota bacterium]|nr:MAG: small subunit ribosomal protein S1 [Bacillota bacterium]MBS3950075.1 bifunctional 4-hydroxy-3-methylbut-2-enyl diphosphate reductase/30S ribosomal protein S1 [Peptococcaceae bacterium]
MRVIVAEPTGMCAGVKRALDMAEMVAGCKGYSLGPVVHNPQVVARLAHTGLKQAALSDVPPQSSVLIRSHGAGPEVYKELQQKDCAIIDATCPHVLRLQRAAVEAVAEGKQVVIVGSRSHPEIDAVVRHTEGQAIVVKQPGELYEIVLKDQIVVLAQTTTPRPAWQTVVEYLQTQGKEVTPIETICTATQERQSVTYELAKQVDIMVIVGGNNSANTRNLTAVSESLGTPTYQVETPDELAPAWFTNVQVAGVVAGASTPEWIIKEVVVAMENMENKVPKEQDAAVENTTAPVEEKTTEGEETLAAVEKTITAVEETTAATESTHFTNLKRGQVVEGKVVSIDAEGVNVDIGQKSEGYISKAELTNDPSVAPAEICQVGDVLNAVVLRIDNKEEKIFLSKRRAQEEEGMKNLAVARDEGRILQGKIVEAVKGGVMVDVLGVKAFMPASHVDLRYVPDLTAFVGQTVSVIVKEIEEARRRVVVSRKEAIERKSEEIKQQTWDGLVPGELRDGVVQRLTDFGAFVDLGGVDGLVHVSEISWQRVAHPSEALTEGQNVKVKILGVDREKGRVSLSIKQGEGDPWSKVGNMFVPGQVVPGKVVRTASFGAFVEIAPGIEGLVHISQLSYDRVEKTEDAVNPGEEVTVKILSIVPEDHRVSLSIKDASERPPQRERTDRPERGERDRGDRGDRRQRDDRNHSYREESKVTLGDKFGDLLKDKK